MAVETLAADKPAQDPWPSQTVGNPMTTVKPPSTLEPVHTFFTLGGHKAQQAPQIDPRPLWGASPAQAEAQSGKALRPHRRRSEVVLRAY